MPKGRSGTNLKRSAAPYERYGVFRHAEAGMGNRLRPLWTRHESENGWPVLLGDVTDHKFSVTGPNATSNLRRQLLRCLLDAGPMGTTRERAFSRLYGWDPEGGPDTGLAQIRVVAYSLNAILEKTGWYIAAAYNGRMWLVRIRKTFVRHVIRRVPLFKTHVVQCVRSST